MSWSLTKSHQEQNISLLSIIMSEASYILRLFWYAILIHENKHRTFSLTHLRKHYLSILEENYLDVHLKSENFALTRVIHIIQRTNQTNNSHNWFDLSSSFYLEMRQFIFVSLKSFDQFSSLGCTVFDLFGLTLVRINP